MPKRKSGFGLFEIVAIALLGGIVYWYHKQHSQGGEDLWSALGYPYGATGNLAGMSGSFKTGNVTGANPNGAALPVVMNAGLNVYHTLGDLGSTLLTDIGGTGLTDVPAPGPSSLFPSRNAAGIKSAFNYSGSKPG
jgi:hypothetical protein